MLFRYRILALLGWLAGLSSGAAAQTLDATPDLSSVFRPSMVTAAIQQTDGKHVVVGWATWADGMAVNGVARYLPNHAPDLTFDANVAGLRGSWKVHNVRQLPSGKLLLIGNDSLRLGSVSRWRLLRLNTDGTPDPGFVPGATLGSSSTRLTTAVQPDGKILVAGFFPTGSATPRRVLRLLPDGTVDNTFASPLTSANGAGSGITMIGVQPDGKIIVAGRPMTVAAGTTRVVARLQPSGALDNTFQTSQLTNSVYISDNTFDSNEVIVLPDGRIVLNGSTDQTASGKIGLLCLEPNGAFSYSLNVVPPASGVSMTLSSLSRQANGQFLIGTAGQLPYSTQRSNVALLNADGTHDTSFDPALLEQGAFQDMALQPDGKIIVGGDFDEISGVRVRNLARLNADGSVDVAFSTRSQVGGFVMYLGLAPGGYVVVGSQDPNRPLRRLTSTGALDASFQVPASVSSYGVFQMLVQPDGRVLVANNGQLLRLLPTGQLDNSFTPVPDLYNGFVLALQPDGKILLGGAFGQDPQTGNPVSSVLRLQANGLPDASFTPLPWDAGFRLGGLAVQSTGHILVSAGYATTNVNRLVRLLPSGQPDATFTPLPRPRVNDGVVNLLVQPNDRILVLASNYLNGQIDLRRLLADGTVDNSFSSVAVTGGTASPLLVQPDGKLVLGGNFTHVGGSPRLNLARLSASAVLHAPSARTAAPLAAWPVPAHHTLHVQLPAGAEAMSLLSLQGQVVRRQVRPGSSAALDVRHLPAGVYLLRVNYAQGAPLTRRVVVE